MGSIQEGNLAHFLTSTTSTSRKRSLPLAVSVQNANKKYSTRKDSSQILNNFSMSVERGHIYSLLGSSGCGKTTLLSCVVGLKELDSGIIRVFGAQPGTKGSGIPGRKVGYMPQEIALYGEFSIAEVLQYFGRLYGMPKWEVEDNTKFLVTFLNLPPQTRRINSLSGGQQRRVSFAVALVHNPELLILDEPTVGVDPLLRKSIWSHLVKLAFTTKTTVIITTHFIEEARESNCIGLMRNGKLLAEDSPEALMRRYNTYVLEDIVVQICLRDTNGEDDQGNSIEKVSSVDSQELSMKSGPVFTPRGSVAVSLATSQFDGPDLNSIVDNEEAFQKPRRPSLGQVLHRASDATKIIKSDFKTETKEKLDRIYASLTKNILVLVRNIGFVAFIIGLPALQIVLVCLAIGIDPHGIKIGVVNYEVEQTSCQEMAPKVGCIMASAAKYNAHASCQFINALNPNVFILIRYNTEAEALRDVQLTKLWGLMSFPVNFTNHLKDRLLFGVYSEQESLEGSKIKFHLDMSNKQVGLQIQKNFYSTLKNFMTKLAQDCKVDTSGLDTPLHFSTPVYGNDDTNFTDFIAPGLLLSVLFFFPLCSTGVSMITEKKSGAMERTKVAGVTDVELLISHFLTQFVLLICQTLLSFAIMIPVFKITVHGSISLAFLMGILIGVSGISFGFFMSSVCRDELQAVLLSLGTFLPNMVLSGVVWPLEGMPFYLKNMAYVLPCTLGAETMRSIIGRGVPFTHPSVWPGFLTTTIYICLYCILTLVIFRMRKRK